MCAGESKIDPRKKKEVLYLVFDSRRCKKKDNVNNNNDFGLPLSTKGRLTIEESKGYLYLYLDLLLFFFSFTWEKNNLTYNTHTPHPHSHSHTYTYKKGKRKLPTYDSSSSCRGWLFGTLQTVTPFGASNQRRCEEEGGGKRGRSIYINKYMRRFVVVYDNHCQRGTYLFYPTSIHQSPQTNEKTEREREREREQNPDLNPHKVDPKTFSSPTFRQDPNKNNR
ncbi:hypothetical protein EYC84_010171 [Monilinia fructicola]|uniref:Uncharacterized protein n=1 Tax=Monilinia fructicola TaxID=38448 RepID=A0A5M9JH18_MONFR|nr:hypothetical protein EYC84_010171 [Monilinia fructicola]